MNSAAGIHPCEAGGGTSSTTNANGPMDPDGIFFQAFGVVARHRPIHRPTLDKIVLFFGCADPMLLPRPMPRPDIASRML